MPRSTTSSCVITYAGIDYHKKFSVVALGDEHGNLIRTERLCNDKVLIRRFFEQYPGVTCALESCRGYEWLLDFLKEDLSLTVHLVNTYKTKLIAQSRAKTDKVDAKIIMQLLAMGFLPTCYQPSPDERRVRERLRWRAHLVRNATRLKVRIRSLVDKENAGLAISRLSGARSNRILSDIALSSARQELLQQHIQALNCFQELVRREDEWVAETVKTSPDACLVKTIPGIGELAALLIIAELGDVQRFRDSGQVAAYVGLVPSIRSSANTTRTGSITKQGSPLLRWILIQCAWNSIRCSTALRMHYCAVSRRCGKNAGVVSVARKLLQIAYRVLRDKKAFQADLVGQRPAA